MFVYIVILLLLVVAFIVVTANVKTERKQSDLFVFVQGGTFQMGGNDGENAA